MNPVTGDLALIDLDGLVVPGVLPPSVLGTSGFMAPEIVTAQSQPSIYTDRHALAVLIYQILLFRHPLRGPKFHSSDAEEDEKLAFGERAVYIEHPTDRSNRPNGNFATSEILGDALRRLFQEAFVRGLKDPASRPQPANWEAELIRLSDRVMPCTNDKCELGFYPFSEGHNLTCPWCATPWKATRSLAILDLFRPVNGLHGQFARDGYSIVAYPGRQLHEWHMYPNRSPSASSDSTPKATFSYETAHKKWVMKNLSSERFRVLHVGKPISDVKPEEQFVLEQDQRIILGEGGDVRIAVVRIGQIR